MNVLITADIHLGEWERYNHPTNPRIEQFQKLSKRYIEIAVENKCEELWIAGDFLRVPTNRSVILHDLKEFLRPLSNHFKKIRYILGQHDINSKEDEIDIKDTIITIFDFDNFEYCNRKVFEFGNTEVAFMDWSPSQSLEWLDHKVDILIAHYTKMVIAKYSQKIDETKFDLCIHGDIHNDKVIDKFVSVCVPFQHDMNCIEEGSCIVLDCRTKKWKRIKTDPDHTRFLRMRYTDDILKEGFETPLLYNVYKGAKVKNQNGGFVDIPNWGDIEKLIESLVEANNFQAIHHEIKAKCVSYSELDFNFQLKSIKIHGFRSVVDFELDFDEKDRIVLLGKNGTGKSSIIRALKSVFKRSIEVNREQSKFTKSVSVTVTLLYQNRLFEITKGKTWGLKIDGVVQPYNKQLDFEKDLPNKLPFFDYPDLFFITSDVQNLASQFKPDRRIELISKFYRLDRVDAYSETANSLKKDLDEKSTSINDSLNSAKGFLESIQNRLEELKDISEVDIDELKEIANGYAKLREDYDNFQEWKSNHEKLVGKKEQLERILKTYEARLNPEEGIEDIVNQIKVIEDEIAKINEQEAIFNKRWRRLTEIIPIKNQLYNKGVELKKQHDFLTQGTCSYCGAKLSVGLAAQKVNELESEMQELKENYTTIYDEYLSYTEEERAANYFENRDKKLKSELRVKKETLDFYTNKKIQYEVAREQFDVETGNLKALDNEILKHESEKPEQIVLPPNLQDLMFEVNTKINRYESYLNELKKRDEKIREIESIEAKMGDILVKSNAYSAYSQFMSRTGTVYEEILKNLAEAFTELDFQYKVESKMYGGNPKLYFNCFYKVRNSYMPYDNLSDGQKTICDLDFFNRLFSVNVGVLVLDETLRHLDAENYIRAGELIESMNVNTVLISTHDTNYTFYTKRILLELDSEGKTESKII